MDLIWLMAAGGGGSSSFGGGGGGGGGGSGGAGGEPWTNGDYVGFLVGVLIFVAIWVFARRRAKRARAAWATRVAHTHAAAAEAVEDDAHFAPATVQAEGVALFMELQRAWNARDDAALAALAGPDLLAEWRLRLADFAAKGWHNQVATPDLPNVQYVGLENRETTRTTGWSCTSTWY